MLFRSVQAFNRTFREAYGVTPAAYRTHGSLSAALAKKRQQSRPSKESVMAGKYTGGKVVINTVAPVRVAALRHQGDYVAIGPTFERLGSWAFGKGLMNGPVRCFGIYYDDPRSKPAAELVADACVSIPADFQPEAPFAVRHTPGGRCAELLHVGPYSELHQAYTWLYCEWLPKSGEEPGDQPAFEENLNDPRSTPPAKLQTAIRIPLKAR